MDKTTLLEDLRSTISYIETGVVSISFHSHYQSNGDIWAIRGPKKNLIVMLHYQNEFEIVDEEYFVDAPFIKQEPLDVTINSPTPEETDLDIRFIAMSSVSAILRDEVECILLDAPDSILPDTPDSILPDTPDSILPDTPDSILPDTPDSILPDTPDSILPDTPDSILPDTPDSILPDTPDMPDTPDSILPDLSDHIVPDVLNATLPHVLKTNFLDGADSTFQSAKSPTLQLSTCKQTNEEMMPVLETVNSIVRNEVDLGYSQDFEGESAHKNSLPESVKHHDMLCDFNYQFAQLEQCELYADSESELCILNQDTFQDETLTMLNDNSHCRIAASEISTSPFNQNQDMNFTNCDDQFFSDNMKSIKLKKCSVLLEQMDVRSMKNTCPDSTQEQENCEITEQEWSRESDNMICPHCGKAFDINVKLHDHKHVRIGKMSYKCSHCDKLVFHQSRLNRNVNLAPQEDEQFQCSACKNTFCDLNSLYVHMQDIHLQFLKCKNKDLNLRDEVQSGKKLIPCSQCDKKFRSKTHLEAHLALHRGKKPYKCLQCGNRFANKYNLNRHRLIHLGIKSYRCTLCDMTFTQKGTLNSHSVIHTRQLPFTCIQCGMKFTRRGSLKRHELIHSRDQQQKLIHSEQRPFECLLCNKKFFQQASLQLHKLVHSGKESYECSLCKKNFSTKSNFQQHQLTHSEIKRYECLQCRKKFSQKKSLNRHNLVHSKQRPYECSLCKKTFRYQSNLQVHKRIHTELPLFVCLQCDKSFDAEAKLKDHLVIHSEEKLHECSECGKKYSQKSFLNRHKLSHNKENFYDCSECDMKFRYVSNLEFHKRVHAGEKLLTT